MDKREEFSLSPWEKARSRVNGLLLAARRGLAFSRDGYSESTTPAALSRWKLTLDPMSQAEVVRLSASYGAGAWTSFLRIDAFRKNIETLWILEAMFLGDESIEQKLGEVTAVVDAGAQDFARLPALAKFLRESSPGLQLTGIE